MEQLSEGTLFAGFRVEEVCGKGGMGIVYRAVHTELARTVALKLIAPAQAADPEFRKRFQREARMTAAIEHPNVIPVYDAGEAEGLLYLAMRHVDGTDLRDLLIKEERLAPEPATTILSRVAAALDAAHASGLVHRDVKPANVLIARGDGHVYLSDFGLAKPASDVSTLTESGGPLGTPDYSSPEQLQGTDSDARSDVYSLGCVLYQTLTGRPPFARPTLAASVLAHVHDPPPVPSQTPGVPTSFDPVIARALAKDPSERYPSAGDLGRAAVAAARGEVATAPERSVAVGEASGGGSPATPPTLPATPHPRRRRLPSARIAALAVAGVAVAAVGALAIAGELPFQDDGEGDAGATTQSPQEPAPPPAGRPSGPLTSTGIGPVQIGDSVREVVAEFGDPDAEDDELTGGFGFLGYGARPEIGLSLLFQNKLGFRGYQSGSRFLQTEEGVSAHDSLARAREAYGRRLEKISEQGDETLYRVREEDAAAALVLTVRGNRIALIDGGPLSPALITDAAGE